MGCREPRDADLEPGEGEILTHSALDLSLDRAADSSGGSTRACKLRLDRRPGPR